MDALTLKVITEKIMEQAKEKKWGTKPEEINVAEKIALIHSEVSETLEAYRHGNMEGKDGFSEEMADILIRVLHLCGIMNVDIEKALINKMGINQGRDWSGDKLYKGNN